MADCVFCKIVRGELPCYKVYEDENFLGFLDIRPLTLGNTLLIPKTHYRWVFDVPNFGQYFEVAKQIALISEKVLGSESTSLLTLGYEIPHAHIRIIPRYPNDLHPTGIDITVNLQVSQDQMLKVSQDILCQTTQK